MSINKVRILVLAGVLAVALAAFSFAHANSSFFAPQAMTATATTTPFFMTPGNATSTLVYDSFNLSGTNQRVVNDPTTADTAALAVQFTASSTASILNFVVERSDDGVDWYQDNVVAPFATTSPVIQLATPISYSWAYASSTINGVGNSGSRLGKVVTIPTPTRFTRVIFSLAAGGTNGAVWAKFIPEKQNK